MSQQHTIHPRCRIHKYPGRDCRSNNMRKGLSPAILVHIRRQFLLKSLISLSIYAFSVERVWCSSVNQTKVHKVILAEEVLLTKWQSVKLTITPTKPCVIIAQTVTIYTQLRWDDFLVPFGKLPMAMHFIVITRTHWPCRPWLFFIAFLHDRPNLSFLT